MKVFKVTITFFAFLRGIWAQRSGVSRHSVGQPVLTTFVTPMEANIFFV
jgi:hypothetical protein